ncbi:MAG: SDR family oxidoreductase [Streptosporangiales bacterium]|nr:SDR family oxidoreductase [Streptosporangiales bacterium]
MNLKDTVAVVTGGGTGIGAAVGEALATAGARGVVVGYSRSADDAEATAERLRGLGCDAIAARADVADEAAVREMAAAALDRYGRVDVLVNNAGTTRFIPFPDLDALTPEVWNEILSVNVIGAFTCSRVLGPALKEARGAIVNVASVAGLRAAGSSLAYGVSKAAMLQLTRGLAEALAPEVRVNSVAPGLVATRWFDRLGPEALDKASERQNRQSPLQATAQPEHVAQAIMAFLTTDMVTGECLVVDAGKHLRY